MNDTQIKEAIIRYLQDESYRYAILINGEWGCGKTHFVLHELKPELERLSFIPQKPIKYISLYGCRSLDEVQERVCFSILDEVIYKKYDLLARVQKVFGRKREARRKKGRILYAASQKAIGTVMQICGVTYHTYEYLTDFFTLGDYHFIFDDLERCACPINDILGYINGLVEHEGAKVILVANENEIGRQVGIQNKELQYLVASRQEIKVPEESLIRAFRGNTNEEPQLNAKELERRRNELFGSIEYDNQYTRIREKLIGLTLQYQADFGEVMRKLILESGKNKELQALLFSKVKYFMEVMEKEHHCNLRTFQFFLSKIDLLYEQFKQLDIEPRYREEMTSFLLENTFLLCVEFKADVPEQKEEIIGIFCDNRKRFKTIEDYVRYSVLDKEAFAKETSQHIKEEYANQLSPDDPYQQLYYQYYLQSQSWVEEKIDRLLVRLKENQYPAALYRNIIFLLVELKNIGFAPQMVEEAMETMIQNIHDSNITETVYAEGIRLRGEESKRECRELLERLNGAIKGTMELSHRRTVTEIVESEGNWAKPLLQYVVQNRRNHYDQQPLFCKVETETWICRLLESDARTINDFRECVNYLYPENEIRSNRMEEVAIIDGILKKLEEHEEPDLIKRAQLKWLTLELKSIRARCSGELQ